VADRFAQHTRIAARAGRHGELVAKFAEAADMQASNPACELTLVSTSPGDPDAVFLTEVWTSAEEHRRATQSPEVQAWAAGMPELVDGPAQTTPLDVVRAAGL
jgi:quinol monooxygenase YgiN